MLTVVPGTCSIALQHDSMVAPVVTTSSTTSTWRPVNASGCMTAKTLAMFSTLSIREWCVCDEVLRVRCTDVVSMGRLKTVAMPLQSSSLWLYPRFLCFFLCNGTGSSMSQSSKRFDRASWCPIIVPIILASRKSPLYLMRCTMCCEMVSARKVSRAPALTTGILPMKSSSMGLCAISME